MERADAGAADLAPSVLIRPTGDRCWRSGVSRDRTGGGSRVTHRSGIQETMPGGEWC